ncbi:MAG TPA: hypothetical protein H9763_06380 [Candidatus Eisenbergiella merdigallinarum]|uniref:Uncharacterized protein n=1 Tax=Candidatus Eisenbergiella merdigallinarum TaxID=2838552 RepID=A0A9D2MSD6_9FIRM|nr:hypothetical protein [Candidatus Eisenbergiella merdigallinarum]
MELKEGRRKESGSARSSVPAVLKNRPLQDGLIALCLTLLLFAFLAFRFDFYYDLNDDVLIKDVLSGVYSGEPDGHTMQLLYPLGAALSLLYRQLPVPVFGLFLLGCQGIAVWAVLRRTAGLFEGPWGRIGLPAAEALFLLASFGDHLVFVQYTVTAGLLASAAIFWLLTGEGRAEGGSFARSFWRENLPALALYWLAFCLRSEMGLLLLPLAGAAGLCLWARRSPFWSRENLAAFGGLFLILAGGMACLWGADSLAYGSGEWKEFRRFFDARTELYDYQLDFVNGYEENREIYEGLGIPQAQQKLLETYNFGADDSIDADWMERLQEAAAAREGGGFVRQSPADALWNLRHRFLSSGDFPLNLAVLAGFFALLLPGIRKGNRRFLWQAPLCLAVGGALWMFLLLRNRPEARVVDPLYLAQLLVFLGLVWPAGKREGAGRRSGMLSKALPAACAVFFLGAAALRLPGSLSELEAESARREEVNRVNEAVMEYCRVRPDSLFLEDVYSTVAYSEKICADREKPFSYDLLGGWLVKSPLTEKKLAAFGFSGMEEAVRSKEGVYLLADETSGSGIGWLEDYFAFRQEDVSVVRVDSIAGRVNVYQVVAGRETGDFGPDAP